MVSDDRSGTAALANGSKPAASNRARILDSAVQVALRDGILAMTLEAVAKEAGVSKGGLLYHFRSKDELLAGMLEYFKSKVNVALETRMASDKNPRGRFLRAFIQTVFEPVSVGDAGSPAPSEMARFMMAMLAASANNPQLLELPLKTMGGMCGRLLDEGPNGLRQLALWPAVYGLLLWQHLGVISPDDPLRQSMLDELLALAEGPAPAVAVDGPCLDDSHINDLT